MRENTDLKSTNADLIQQNVHLLVTINEMQGVCTPHQEHSASSNKSPDEIFSKRMVNFKDITELQENNQRLLLLVRELSQICEEFDIIKEAQVIKDKEVATKLWFQEQVIALGVLQKDRFKNLFYKVWKEKVSADNHKGNIINQIAVDLATAKAELIQYKNKDAKIRKLANRYTDSWEFELEELQNKIAAQPLSDRIFPACQTERTTQIAALQERHDQIRDRKRSAEDDSTGDATSLDIDMNKRKRLAGKITSQAIG